MGMPSYGKTTAMHNMYVVLLKFMQKYTANKSKNMNKTSVKGYRQLRKGRKSIPGAHYFVTVATFDRTHVLTATGVPEIIFKCFN